MADIPTYEELFDTFVVNNSGHYCPNCEKDVAAKEVTLRGEKYYECPECHAIWGAN